MFESWITCVCSPYVCFLLTMWSGKSLQLLCIFPFAMLCLSAISILFVNNADGSVCVGGYGGLSESGIYGFREMCPVSFLIVGESLSVLL